MGGSFKISAGFVRAVSGRDFVARVWRWSIALATGDQPQNWRDTGPEDLGKKRNFCGHALTIVGRAANEGCRPCFFPYRRQSKRCGVYICLMSTGKLLRTRVPNFLTPPEVFREGQKVLGQFGVCFRFHEFVRL